MEQTKKIKVNYSGSWVNTTKVFAFLFLIAGIITAAAIFFSADSYKRDEVVGSAIMNLAASILIFLSLIAISKVLQHLLFARKYLENKAFTEGYEFVEENNNI